MMPQQIASGSKPSIDIEELIAQPKNTVAALLKALKLCDPVRPLVQAPDHPPRVPYVYIPSQHQPVPLCSSVHRPTAPA
jgi:hypothetical protein